VAVNRHDRCSLDRKAFCLRGSPVGENHRLLGRGREKRYKIGTIALDTQKPFIIPVFLPHHGCLHQCIFCDQTAITGNARNAIDVKQIRLNISEFLGYRSIRHHPVQIAFFGGNFLGLKLEQIKSLLDLAAEFVRAGKVDGIRFSTRPDTIDEQRLNLIASSPVSTIEIGAQSMDDRILAASNRGHTAMDTQTAAALLKARNYEFGLQIMVGLPGDDETKALATGRKIVDLSPDFVRIYPTLVLAGSPLARAYQKGNYSPWSLERTVAVVKDLFLLFKKNRIRVIRMGLQPSQELEKESTLLAGPYHPAFGHLVHEQIFLDMALTALESEKGPHKSVVIKVHPKSISKARGLNNKNVVVLKKIFQIESIDILSDPLLAEDTLSVQCNDIQE
jgi:histone acetyltransferase (RNA polymerase elongator complex component)